MTTVMCWSMRGGSETRWRMLVGMGADVVFGGLQTACVDTTMKMAA